MTDDSNPGGDDSARDSFAHAHTWFGSVDGTDADPLVGTTLGRSYEILAMLGEGAMGRVYEAHHTRIPTKRFAIKVLHPQFRRHPDALTRFQREAEAAAAITHPNVVGVYDVDEAPDGQPYLVCEFLEGIDLGEHLEKVGKLRPRQALRIARQLCAGLSAAHAAGVVHRDIKPDNVFLVGNIKLPVAKVLDFGLSRLSQTGGTITEAGTVIGTPAYMAPEQALGGTSDERTDVYGVGAVLYRALTGQCPFERPDLPSTLAAVLTEEPPRPRSIVPAISEQVEMVIQRAMAQNPEERYQSARELDAAIEAIEGSDANASTAPSTDAPPSTTMLTPADARSARSRLVLTVLVGVLWVFGVLAAGITNAFALVVGRSGQADLSMTELTLVLAVIVGVAITPLVIGLRAVRNRSWDNTLRVVQLTRTLRVALLASAASYGAAALLVGLVDGVMGRYVDSDLAAGPIGIAWPPWSIVFLSVAGLAALLVVLSKRWLTAGATSSRGRQLLAGPVLATAGVLTAAGMLYGGLSWRTSAWTGSDNQRASAAEPSDDDGDSTAERKAPTKPASAGLSAAPSTSAFASAPAARLDAALAGGTTALERLALEYPKDPAVMRSLVSVYAKKKEGYLRGLEWGERLVAQDIEQAKNKTLRVLLLRAAQSEEPAATRAFQILASKVGHHGPDLLYDLVIGSEKNVRERATQLLAHEDVQKLAEPAVLIAFQLRTAETCDDTVALLDRAIEHGDKRSLAVLTYIAEGSRTGCGPRRRGKCPARCGGVEPIDAALAKVRDRVSQAG